MATGVQDIGTGSRSVLANTVAGAFDLEPAAVEVRIGDSRLVSGPTSGGEHGHGDARPGDARRRRRGAPAPDRARGAGERGAARSTGRR